MSLLLVAALVPNAAESAQKIKLGMYHKESNKLLYEAERTIETSGGRVTERTVFVWPGNTPIQESETVYEQSSLKLISHRMNDSRIGLMEEINVAGGKVNIKFREAKGEDVESDELDWTNDMIVSATILPLLRRNWKKVQAGEDVVFKLIVASRQGTVSFRLRKKSAAEIDGQPVTIVVLEPDSFIIRALVDAMYFSLADAPPHRLLRYVGRTSVKTDEGDDQDLRVRYTYK